MKKQMLVLLTAFSFASTGLLTAVSNQPSSNGLYELEARLEDSYSKQRSMYKAQNLYETFTLVTGILGAITCIAIATKISVDPIFSNPAIDTSSMSKWLAGLTVIGAACSLQRIFDIEVFDNLSADIQYETYRIDELQREIAIKKS